MNEEAHVIDIESIVLMDVNPGPPGKLSALIEAEVQRILSGAGFSAATGVADSETSVAAEVARTVTQSIQGEVQSV